MPWFVYMCCDPSDPKNYIIMSPPEGLPPCHGTKTLCAIYADSVNDKPLITPEIADAAWKALRGEHFPGITLMKTLK